LPAGSGTDARRPLLSSPVSTCSRPVPSPTGAPASPSWTAPRPWTAARSWLWWTNSRTRTCPAQRHARRWQDVGELLAGGIDVYTTLNVANLESLGQVVSRITGARPAEPVPDAFVRAGEITLVDLAPSALRHRLAQGLVFPEDRVDVALSSYFRFANLAALRELAQLWLDDSVPDPVAAFTAARGVSGPVQASVIMVGLAGSPADEWLIRYAAHLAGLSGARLKGVHVTAIDNLDPPPRARLTQDRRLLGVVNVGRPGKTSNQRRSRRHDTRQPRRP
jgi:hypothetical protein